METGKREIDLGFWARLRGAARTLLRTDRQDAFGEWYGTQHSSLDPYARMFIRSRRRLAENEVFELYRSFGIAANAVDIPAEDMTRAGFDFVFQDEPEIEERITNKLRELNIVSVLHDICRYELLSGDGFAVIGAEGAGANMESDLMEVAQRGQLRSLKFLHPFHGYNVEDIELEDNILSERYGRDKFIKLKLGDGQTMRLHASRVLHLQLRGFNKDKFGSSIYERLLSNLQVFDTTHWSLGQLMYSLFFKVIQSPRFSGMSEEERQRVLRNLGSSLNSLTYFVMDSDEKMEIVSPSAHLSGFDAAANFLWDMLAASTRVPKHHLLGQRQGALTGAEWDSRVYYARIRSLQETYLRELIEYIVRMLLMSQEIAGMSVGQVEKSDWDIEFKPLFTEDEKEKVEREFKQSQTHAIYLQYGVVSSDEIRAQLDWVEGESPMAQAGPETPAEQPDILSPGRFPQAPRPKATVPSSGRNTPSPYG